MGGRLFQPTPSEQFSGHYDSFMDADFLYRNDSTKLPEVDAERKRSLECAQTSLAWDFRSSPKLMPNVIIDWLMEAKEERKTMNPVLTKENSNVKIAMSTSWLNIYWGNTMKKLGIKEKMVDPRSDKFVLFYCISCLKFNKFLFCRKYEINEYSYMLFIYLFCF